MVATAMINPDELLAPHGADDTDKLAELTASMRETGWQGAPLIYARMSYGDQALTGSHRLAAAQAADIQVPAVDIAALMDEHGADWNATVNLQDEGSFEVHYLALLHVIQHGLLPEETIAFYGLDVH